MSAKRPTKCLFSCLIVFVTIILALTVSILVLMNQTPSKLKISDKKFFGKYSFTDIGLENLKIKEITHGISKLRNFNENSFISRPFDTNKEAQNATAKLNGSNYQGDSINLHSLLTEKAIYDNAYLINYNDTTLAFIFNSVLSGTNDNVLIKEVSFSNEKTPVVRIVISFPEIKADFAQSSLFLSGFSNSPLVTLSFNLTVSSDGTAIIPENEKNKKVNVIVNDGDKMITTYFNHVFKQRTKKTLVSVCEKIAENFIIVLNNLGKIGTANTNDGNVIQGTPSFDASAIAKSTISLISHC